MTNYRPGHNRRGRRRTKNVGKLPRLEDAGRENVGLRESEMLHSHDFYGARRSKPMMIDDADIKVEISGPIGQSTDHSRDDAALDLFKLRQESVTR